MNGSGFAPELGGAGHLDYREQHRLIVEENETLAARIAELEAEAVTLRQRVSRLETGCMSAARVTFYALSSEGRTRGDFLRDALAVIESAAGPALLPPRWHDSLPVPASVRASLSAPSPRPIPPTEGGTTP